MKEIGRRKSLGDHVAGFHQLDRKLVGIGIVEPAPHHHTVVHKPIALHHGLDPGRQTEGSLGKIRDLVKPFEIAAGERFGQHVEKH